MRKYLYLQLKRAWKVFPLTLAVVLALFLGIGVIVGGLLYKLQHSEESRKFKIGLAGDTDNSYLDLGMSLLKSVDDTRFVLEFIEMSEADAEKNLANGELSAYVLLPENFVEHAMYGDVRPITYVTTPGVGGIVALFKNEVTELVTDIVVYSQKGVYGVGYALDENGAFEASSEHIYNISLEYVDLVLDRSKLYEVEELGIYSGLSMPEYYVCGVVVLLLMLMGLPYATVSVKRDYAFQRVLVSKEKNAAKQLLCEYLAHLVMLLALATVIFILLCIGGGLFGDVFVLDWTFYLRMLAIVAMIAAFNMMLFEIAGNLVNGILIHFFASLCLCYSSGCFYPIYTFPKVMQETALYLPTGVARNYLAGGFTGDAVWFEFLGLVVYVMIFGLVAFAVRKDKTRTFR